jgi:uncharacterized protein (TIGR03437 family)
MLKLMARCCWVLLAGSASLAIAQTVTVRSGNGIVGGRDSSVTFLLGPADTDFSSSFTQADFSDAQHGPAAFIIPPNPLWVPGLSADPNAKWIGTSSSSSSVQGNTALYAISFTIPSTFSSATLTLNYAVDDGLGTVQPGLYLNGQAVCQNLIATTNQFVQEHTLTCTGISALLQVGTNWLYFDDVNATGPAGLLFSATITTTDLGTLPTITKVTNAASYATGPVSPGEIISIFADPSGSYPIGPTPAVGLNSANCPSPCTNVPTTMGGVQVEFLPTGVYAPLTYVSATQINCVVPYEVQGVANLSVEVKYLGQASNAFVLQTAATAPGIFTSNYSGTGTAAMGQYDTSGNYQGINSSSNPASPGWYLTLWVTGEGFIPSTATGSVTSTTTVKPPLGPPTVLIDGLPAGGFYFYYAEANGFVSGLMQVNVQIPTGIRTGQADAISLSIGGNASQNGVTISVGPLSFNPQPSVASLSPSSGTAGSNPLVLTINGSGFIASSTVTFNGILHSASLVNSGQLNITLTASDLATAGGFPVVVSNPSPGGGSSSPVNFSVLTAPVLVPPAPTGLSPGSTVPPGPTVGTLTPTLSWNTSPGATGYTVVIINTVTGNSAPANVSATSVVSPTLTYGDTYEWSVAAFNSSGLGPVAAPVYFTVAAGQTGLTGNWTGAWGSIPTGAFGTMSATLVQTGTALTGSISLSSICFPGGPLSGTVSGNAINATITISGFQLAALDGTVSTDASSINGAYLVTYGSCTGDYGIYTLSRSK